MHRTYPIDKVLFQQLGGALAIAPIFWKRRSKEFDKFIVMAEQACQFLRDVAVVFIKQIYNLYCG